MPFFLSYACSCFFLNGIFAAHIYTLYHQFASMEPLQLTFLILLAPSLFLVVYYYNQSKKYKVQFDKTSNILPVSNSLPIPDLPPSIIVKNENTIPVASSLVVKPVYTVSKIMLLKLSISIFVFVGLEIQNTVHTICFSP